MKNKQFLCEQAGTFEGCVWRSCDKPTQLGQIVIVDNLHLDGTFLGLHRVQGNHMYEVRSGINKQYVAVILFATAYEYCKHMYSRYGT